MTGIRAALSPVRRLRDLRAEFDGAIFVLAAGDLVASFGFSLVFPFLTIYLTARLHATATEAGAIVGLYSLVSIGSNAVGGWLADRIGRKPVMLTSISLTTVVIALMGLVGDLAWVTLLIVVLGVVDPPFVPAARAAVADVVPAARRPRAYGLLSMAASVGWIVGPSVGAGLSSLGYGVLFVVAGGIIGIYALILAVAFHDRWRRPEAGGAGAEATDGAVRPAHVAIPAPAVGAELPFRAPDPEAAGDGSDGPRVAPDAGPRPSERRAAFAIFLVLATVIHATSFQWVVTLPIHAAADLGISTTTWGLLFALNGLLILVLQLRVTSAAEGRSRPGFMAIGAAWYGAGYVVVALLPGPDLAVPALALTVILVTFGEMSLFPVEPAFVSELADAGHQGRDQGLLGAAIGLGSALGPVLGGMVLDRAPGPTLWAATAAGCLAVSLGLVWLGRLPGARLPPGSRPATGPV